VRATIINVMGDFKKKSFMSTVREALKDPDARVRSNAIEAMETMGGEEIVDYIYPLLEDENNA
jgi:HEAT repeat protein